MKHKILILVYFFTCISLLANAQSTVLRITKTGNSTLDFQVSQISKVLFNDSTMIINMTDGFINNIPISSIRSFVVRDFTKLVEIEQRTLVVYPNPVSSNIMLLNLDYQTHLADIYAVTGQLLLQKFVSFTNNIIDVSALKEGIYVLKLNGQTIKFTKK